MRSYLVLLGLVTAAWAETPKLPDLQTLPWQVEAQARERAVARRVEQQTEKARPARADPSQFRPALEVHPDRTPPTS